ncbi:hypothetical protein HN385_02770 [archaeon]|jgi:hypothetical protein|nr:hypothetical protein [archaeon]MBT3450674.1 hypothetical protein [archaeon]MBT6868746.1 hypothetical protein [archaeon]MBT7193033.1 hypothetical protein [archaeon]MBT7380999.1 hypothetical protein [archaeon]
MTEKFSLLSDKNQFGAIDYALRENQINVFLATLTKNKAALSVYWDVSINKTKEQYFDRLVQFDKELKEGNYLDNSDYGPAPGFASFVSLNNGTLEKQFAKLEEIKDEKPYQDMSLIWIGGVHANYTMETLVSEQWKPENGRISIQTNQDISDHLAPFIADTSMVQVTSEEIKPYLTQLFSHVKRQ